MLQSSSRGERKQACAFGGGWFIEHVFTVGIKRRMSPAINFSATLNRAKETVRGNGLHGLLVLLEEYTSFFQLVCLHLVIEFRDNCTKFNWISKNAEIIEKYMSNVTIEQKYNKDYKQVPKKYNYLCFYRYHIERTMQIIIIDSFCKTFSNSLLI